MRLLATFTHSGSLIRIAVLGAVTASLHASPALATFHMWRFNEIYSNASGTVQFVELFDEENGETLLQNHTLKSAGNTFTFPTNLPPGTATAGHHLLLATPGYFALRGVPQADYNLGVNNFFNIAGDSLNFADVDTLTFTGNQLPTDNRTALARVAPSTGAALTTAVNSPTALSDASGVIPPWENQNNRFDVTNDGNVFNEDALRIINELLIHQAHALDPPGGAGSPPPFFDVSGDNKVNPKDVSQVISLLLLAQQQVQPAAEPLMQIAAVPEPASAALLAAGAVLAVAWMRRARVRNSWRQTAAPSTERPRD